MARRGRMGRRGSWKLPLALIVLLVLIGFVSAAGRSSRPANGWDADVANDVQAGDDVTGDDDFLVEVQNVEQPEIVGEAQVSEATETIEVEVMECHWGDQVETACHDVCKVFPVGYDRLTMRPTWKAQEDEYMWREVPWGRDQEINNSCDPQRVDVLADDVLWEIFAGNPWYVEHIVGLINSPYDQDVYLNNWPGALQPDLEEAIEFGYGKLIGSITPPNKDDKYSYRDAEFVTRMMKLAADLGGRSGTAEMAGVLYDKGWLVPSYVYGE